MSPEPLVLGDIAAIHRVSLQDLTAQIDNEAYRRAAETLTISLSKYNCCILQGALHRGPNAALWHQLLEKVVSKHKSWLLTQANNLAQPILSLSYDPLQRRSCLTCRLGQCHTLPDGNDIDYWANLNTVWHSSLERAARAVLAAVCRSCTLRLRSDTFSSVLDDLPVPAHMPSSSLLNFSRHTLAEHVPASPTALDRPGNGHSVRSIISLMHFTEAQTQLQPPCVASSTQVQAADGRWHTIKLEPWDVLVLVGQAAHHMTAGILPITNYRVVGDPVAHRPRHEMRFDLCAQPGALVDFSAQLKAAGHVVPDRYQQPLPLQQLLDEWETRLSPLGATPAVRDVASTHHNSGSSVRGYLSVERIDERRGTKRDMSTLGNAGATECEALTSGHLERGCRRATRLRSKLGTENGSGVAPAGAAGVPQDVAAQHVSRVMITLDTAAVADTSNVIKLCLSALPTGAQVWFRLQRNTPCGVLFEEFATQMGQELGSVQFLYGGQRVLGSATPAELNINDGDHITMTAL